MNIDIKSLVIGGVLGATILWTKAAADVIRKQTKEPEQIKTEKEEA